MHSRTAATASASAIDDCLGLSAASGCIPLVKGAPGVWRGKGGYCCSNSVREKQEKSEEVKKRPCKGHGS